MVAAYVPQQGDIVWVIPEKPKGHEQSGRRPALVVSGNSYNKHSGMCIVCFITSKKKGYPFEVDFESKTIKGCVLADQIRLFDYAARKFKMADKVDRRIFLEVSKKIKKLVS